MVSNHARTCDQAVPRGLRNLTYAHPPRTGQVKSQGAKSVHISYWGRQAFPPPGPSYLVRRQRARVPSRLALTHGSSAIVGFTASTGAAIQDVFQIEQRTRVIDRAPERDVVPLCVPTGQHNT